MNGKAARLERLLAIRRLREESDRNEMARVAAAVIQVEKALEEQESVLVEARNASRQALAVGDRTEWLMADAQNEVVGWNRGRLRVLLGKRLLELPPAMQRFMESRREHEQVKVLVQEARLEVRATAERREQAAADDWFLSRYVRLGSKIMNRS